MNTAQEPKVSLPVRRNLTAAYVSSSIIAVLVAAASIAGLVWRADVYPSEELVRAFLSNDVVNLVIGLPILLGSMWLARRDRLVGNTGDHH